MTLQFQKKDPRITITTQLGEIKIRLYPDAAPRHVENIINLVKMGFYDGTTFHRVIRSVEALLCLMAFLP